MKWEATDFVAELLDAMAQQCFFHPRFQEMQLIFILSLTDNVYIFAHH
jgi:hypothetical protein